MFDATVAAMDIHERLKKARIARGFKTPTAAAKALTGGSDSGVSTYLGHENGNTPPPRDAITRYADLFGVSAGWLLTGKGTMKGGLVPVVGEVGAGAEVYPDDPYPKGEGQDMVDAPAGAAADVVALLIRGESMHPIADGWMIFYRRDQDGVPQDCVGRLCVVKVHDGPTLLKELYPGKTAKTWSLRSWNAPARENVRLDWAARVIDIRPR